MRCLHPWNVARLFYGQFSLPLCFVGSWISFGGIFIFNWFTRGFRFRGSARVDRGNKLRNVFNFRKMLVLLSGNSIDRALYIFLCVIFRIEFFRTVFILFKRNAVRSLSHKNQISVQLNHSTALKILHLCLSYIQKSKYPRKKYNISRNNTKKSFDASVDCSDLRDMFRVR